MPRWILAGLAAAVATGVLCIAAAGDLLSRPVHHAVGLPPGDLEAESIDIPYANERLSGWLLRGKPGAGAMLLLHGVRSDRRQMSRRAAFLHRIGYSVLLVDLPAHGESSGARITFGVHEAEGVKAALAYLAHEMPADPVGVVGVSLGAASLVLAGPDPRVRAVVLESMYPTIEDAVGNRLRHYLGPAGGVLEPLLLWQLPLRIGISPEQLRPLAHIDALQAPVFIISGARDWHTTPAETQRLFDAAPQPRQLWIVEGAAHVDLHAFAPRDYETRVSTFLARHLNPR